MTCLRRLAFMLALVAPPAFVAGCAQGEGERCQVQSDCATGLSCILPAGSTPQAGGICQRQNNGDLSIPNTDIGAKVD